MGDAELLQGTAGSGSGSLPKLTELQRKVLQYLVDGGILIGHAPTIDELRVKLDVRSTSTVDGHLKHLRASTSSNERGSGGESASPGLVAVYLYWASP